MKRLVFVLVAGSFALATPYAQEHDHSAAAKAPAARAASAARPAADVDGDPAGPLA